MINQLNSVTVLICNSNMFVPYVLTEVLTHSKEDYLILTDIDNIKLFLGDLNLSNADVLRYYQPTWSHIYSPRRELLTLTNNYNISRIVFFHTEFGCIINWYLLKKSKSTNILFCKVFNKLPYPPMHGYKAWKTWLRERILSGVNMEILNSGMRPIPSLSELFYRKVKAKPYCIKINYPIIKSLLSDRFQDVNFNAKVVLCTGATVLGNYVKQAEYIKKTDALIEAIGENNCVAKCHPRFNDVFSKEIELSTIPSYVPGNLIIGSYDVFIGNHSTLLVEAAIAGKIAISLVDYYEPVNKEQIDGIKAFYKDRLGGKAEIYYPTTIDQIIDIVKRIFS